MFFVCAKCDCVDTVELAYVGQMPAKIEDQLCTFCKTGTWHDLFEREEYDPAKDNVVNRETGFSV